MKESKRKMDEKFGRKLNEKFDENKKVVLEGSEKNSKRGVVGVKLRIKIEDGVHIRHKDMKTSMEEYFKG